MSGVFTMPTPPTAVGLAQRCLNAWAHARLRQTVFWLAVWAVAVLSLLPGPYLPPVAFNVWDKAQHAGAFTALALWGLWAYPAHPLRLLLALLGYGVAIEVAQWATGWRYGDWQDWTADAVGVAMGYGLWRLGLACLAGPSEGPPRR
jgi:VanZ family protein